MVRTLIAAAALAALAAGCASPELHVVGDRPAEVYVRRETATLTEAIKEKLDLGPSLDYVGRTRLDGDASAGPARNGATAGGTYGFVYRVPGHPARLTVEVKAAERTWTYDLDLARVRDVTVFYPKIGEEAPPAPPPSEPPAGAPQPASIPR
jgi:hypothetical protein